MNNVNIKTPLTLYYTYILKILSTCVDQVCEMNIICINVIISKMNMKIFGLLNSKNCANCFICISYFFILTRVILIEFISINEQTQIYKP
jgi:hypothetical protein